MRKWAYRSLLAVLGVLALGFPVWDRIKPMFVSKDELNHHITQDLIRDDWTKYGFANQRQLFLGDKKTECALRQSTDPKDVAVCKNFSDQWDAAKQAADRLQEKAMSSSKEKVDP